MKKYFLSLLFFSSLFSAAQNPLVKMWDYRFGGDSMEMFTCIIQTNDGGFLLGGTTDSPISGDKTDSLRGGAGDYDYWIVKLDSLGNKQWDKDYGGTGGEELYTFQQTSDGGFLLGGSSGSAVSGDKTQASWGDYDYWIVKIDDTGNKQWDKDLGGTFSDKLTSIQQTVDGGYILGGISYSGISGDKTQAKWGNSFTDDYWIIKTDSLGNKLWDKDFGGTGSDDLTSILQTSDGGYLIGGSSISNISGDKTQANWGTSDFWIIKSDSLGNKEWDKDFGGINGDYLSSILKTIDGGYLIGGYSYSGIGGDKTQNSWGLQDYWIIKTDSNCNILWDKDLGGTGFDILNSIQQTPDSGYLLGGSSTSNISGDKTESNLGQQQTWFVKTDIQGARQWDKTVFNMVSGNFGLTIEIAGKCYMAANTSYGGIGGYQSQPTWNNSSDYWIIKFCDSNLTTSSTLLEKAQNAISIFPNPTSEQFTINSWQFPITQIEIYDALGNKIYSSATNCESCLVNCTFLSPGIYFVKAMAGDKIFYNKFIKE